MRIAFYTLGCKVNQYETENLKSRFSAEGFEVTEPAEEADVYVVNSCTVTATGDQKTRQVLRRFRRQNPSAVVCLTGCMPQAFPEKAEHLPEAQVITGSCNRAGLVANVKEALATGRRVIDITPHQKGEKFEEMRTERFSDKTRAFVKIEDGCDRYCAYCIIPKARGPVRSKALEDLEQEVRTLAGNGYREVVLAGVNLSSYGKDTGYRMADAVECACAVPGIERVRLGSLEPELLSDDDIGRLSRLPKFCPQFHLSLQSGCDATLKRMGRHYDTALYRALVEKLRRVFPGCAITTDIMVGFPGETEDEFSETLEFTEEMGFAQAHIFAYSVREGTRAAAFPGQVPQREKEKRSRKLMETVSMSREMFLKSMTGKTEPVLFERKKGGNTIIGHTKNFMPVSVAGPAADGPEPGDIAFIDIIQADGEGCIGKLHR